MAVSSTFPAGTVLANRFVVLNTLFGGMGEVIVCKDSHDNSNRKALKSYQEQKDQPALRDLFLREAHTWIELGEVDFLMKLDNILDIFGKPYLLMDYCSEGSLRDRIARGSLPYPDAIAIGTQLAVALHNLHGFQKPVIHRDVKPENILFRTTKTVALTDLGLAKAWERVHPLSSHPGFSGPVGTLPYCAPEQVLDPQHADGRVDVWAFGVVLFEMIMAHRPFQGNSPDTLVRNIVGSVPHRWREFTALVPKECSAIVERCLEKDSSKRHRGFRELLMDWDNLVVTKYSPKWSGWFKKDPRVSISDEMGGFYIQELFPERATKAGKHIYETRTKFTEYKAYQDACQYRRVGSYEEALASCTTILGNVSDPQSNLNRLLLGQVDRAPRLEESWSEVENKTLCRVRITPNQQLLHDSLVQLMCVYVDLIESRGEQGKQHIEPFTQLAEHIIQSYYVDYDVLSLCAQAYLKAERFSKAIRLLEQLINTNPTNARPWWTLVATLLRAGSDSEVIATTVRRIHDNLANQVDDYLSQYVSGKASIVIGNWSLGAQFMARAFKLDPNSLEVLHDWCACLLNAGLVSEARTCFEQLQSIAPSSAYTVKLRSCFLKK